MNTLKNIFSAFFTQFENFFSDSPSQTKSKSKSKYKNLKALIESNETVLKNTEAGIRKTRKLLEKLKSMKNLLIVFVLSFFILNIGAGKQAKNIPCEAQLKSLAEEKLLLLEKLKEALGKSNKALKNIVNPSILFGFGLSKSFHFEAKSFAPNLQLIGVFPLQNIGLSFLASPKEIAFGFLVKLY